MLRAFYLKNGKSDLKNSTTLQIANSILYNFYFMLIYHISTFFHIKLSDKGAKSKELKEGFKASYSWRAFRLSAERIFKL